VYKINNYALLISDVNHNYYYYKLCHRCAIAPLFQVSCVTGEGLNLLFKFLNTVPPVHSRVSQDNIEHQLPEFHVDELFNVPDVGIVLSGILTSGVVQIGDPVLVGPNDDGGFVESKVATLRRNRIPCRMVRAGQAATVTLNNNEQADFRKVIIIMICVYIYIYMYACI